MIHIYHFQKNKTTKEKLKIEQKINWLHAVIKNILISNFRDIRNNNTSLFIRTRNSIIQKLTFFMFWGVFSLQK